MSSQIALFTEKLNEEVYNVISSPNNNYVSVFDSLRNQSSISSTFSITSSSNSRENQPPSHRHHNQHFFSRVSTKINSLLLSLSTSPSELINNLQSILSSTVSGGNNHNPLTVQQQLAYLLAMYQIVNFSSEDAASSTYSKYHDSVIDFIHFFLRKKLECYFQCDKDNYNQNDESSFLVVLRQSMTFYVSFIDYLLDMEKLKVDENNNDDNNDDNNNDNNKLTTLSNEIKNAISSSTEGEKQQQEQPKESLSSSSKDILLSLNLPADSKEQLQILYKQDMESFNMLQPFLLQMHNQQQQYHDHQQDNKIIPNFVRPLPPLSNFSNQVDLFDYDSCIDESLDTFYAMNTAEMKDDDEDDNDNDATKANNNDDHDSQNAQATAMSPCSYYNYHQDHCNKRLFFLHPTDPFLRFVYMNTTSLYHNQHKLSTETHMSTLIEDDDIDSSSPLNGIDPQIQNDLIQILEEAFTRSLDANEEEKVLQFLTKATAISSSNSAVKSDHNEDIEISILFQQMLSVVLKCGLTPDNLPTLVKYNHTIANQCLLILLLANNNGSNNESNNESNQDRTTTFISSSLKKEYLSALVGMDISLESMEVVYQLATYSHDFVKNEYQNLDNNSSNDEDDSPHEATEKKRKGMMRRSTKSSMIQSRHNSNERSKKVLLSPEYIHMFVSNFISSCENTQDRNRRYKYVRLLSVFLQTLIQKQIVKVEVRVQRPSNHLFMCVLVANIQFLFYKKKRTFTLKFSNFALISRE
jgi:hypothetical protein